MALSPRVPPRPLHCSPPAPTALGAPDFEQHLRKVTGSLAEILEQVSARKGALEDVARNILPRRPPD
jgi:hypothetical protein